jgi:hypothetical protein
MRRHLPAPWRELHGDVDRKPRLMTRQNRLQALGRTCCNAAPARS